jgi:FlaA1/EpsC-like NDP-sugar epimerase
MGDQLLITFGLLSALFANYRLLSITVFPIHTILYRLAIHAVLAVSAWVIFRVYKKVIRFFSSKDYLNLIIILFLVHFVSALSNIFFPVKHQLKPEIFIISFFITSIYIIGSRFIISYLYFYYNKSKKGTDQKKLLIYGAGELGVFLKKSINTQYQDEYKLVAFLDDDKKKIGRFIGGVKVIDASKDIKNEIVKSGVTDIIIANKTLTPARKSKFLEDTLPYNVKIKEISSIQTMFNSNFNLDKLASIDINDLMNRKPIHLYDEHVVENLKDKVVMVTGAAGSIGSEIVRKLSEHDATLIVCVDFSESALYDLEQELKRKHPKVQYRFILTDIRNEELMENVFIEYAPNFIYHAAAYKHVPLMEQFPWEAVQTNVFGTWSIVKQAIRFKAEKFVFISSDKAVNPTSVMGATKRLAEIIVQAFSSSKSSTCFVVTRFGNVLGSNGSVVPLFKKQIQAGGPVTVTHPEMIRYFMTIAEACQLVLEASVMADGGEVFVFDMGEPVKIVDLAKNMIRLAGYTPDVDIKIEFIGERPGEKLYEEVFSKNEKMKETHHEKIMISKESMVQLQEAENIIAKLKSLEGFYEPELFRVVIKDLIPEYQSVAGNTKVVNFTTGKKINQYKYQN